MKRLLIFFLTLAALCHGQTNFKALVFTKTQGFRHDAIPNAVKALKKMAQKNHFMIHHSEDSNEFNDANLAQYKVVIFLLTTGDILDSKQQKSFQNFIQAGGGFVGIHAATDTEYNWPWYTRLVGAQFLGHPENQNAVLDCVDHQHQTTNFLPKRWQRYDEWYDFKNLNPRNKVLLNLDETTYKGGQMGKDHPAAWYKEFDGGRMFYTAGGHTKESYSEALFLKHLLEGIKYTVSPKSLNIKKSLPDDEYFEARTIAKDLIAPVELTIVDEDKIFILERGGAVKLLNPKTRKVKKIHQIDVLAYFKGPGADYGLECGGLGITKDPNFANNKFLYIYYSPKNKSVNRLSRFTFDNDTLKNEKIVLEIKTDRKKTNHEGGSLAFGKDRLLYLSTGDNTNPFESNGFAPIDERDGRKEFDAQRTAGNSNDLRGSILRIIMNEDGTYSIPPGNLWAQGTAKTRPEIYVKGCRNPYRLSIDTVKDYVYWGDVGPDSGKDNEKRGSRGHDELNQARNAAFYGWPYFRGNNMTYRDFDFATGKSGKLFSEELSNNSPNNSGLVKLPKSTSSLIWYPHAKSSHFPELGTGGRSAMAGPAFHQQNLGSLPEYFDNTVIFYEWSRGFIKLVKLDENGDVVAIHPFMASKRFIHPIDIERDVKGNIYVLEYGSQWLDSQDDGVLKKITFSGFNRAPIAVANVNKNSGSLPLEVKFSSAGSFDKDKGDKLTYNWDFGNGQKSSDPNPSIIYNQAGQYKVSLTVSDQGGRKARKELTITAGNEAPVVKLTLNKTKSFSWNETLTYQVSVTDKEDSKIDPQKIRVTAEYLPSGLSKNTSSNSVDPRLKGMPVSHPGTSLIVKNNCLACHQGINPSIGPSYKDIAFKYSNNEKSKEYLIKKIQQGSGGVWGHAFMPPHAHIKSPAIKTMVEAILSLRQGSVQVAYGKKGEITLDACPSDPKNAEGVYLITASYVDNGANGLPGLRGSHKIILKSKGFLPSIKNSELFIGAKHAKINGNGARLGGDIIGFYTDVNTSLTWEAYAKEAGHYDIQLSQAIPQANGSEYKISCNGNEITAKLKSTGSWGKYENHLVGQLTLKKGLNTIIFQPLIINHCLPNIKGIHLSASSTKPHLHKRLQTP